MDDKQEIRILDARCGSRMFWWDKTEPHTTFMDIRQENRDITNGSITKHVTVNPDVIADFRHMPFPDNHFDLVVRPSPPDLGRTQVLHESTIRATTRRLALLHERRIRRMPPSPEKHRHPPVQMVAGTNPPGRRPGRPRPHPHPRRQARLNPLGSLPQTTQPPTPRRHGIPARNPPRRNLNTSVR